METIFEKSISDPTPVDRWEEYTEYSGGRIEYHTPEQVIQYRRDFIKNNVFRWLRDGQRRFNLIIDQKIDSYNKYKDSYRVYDHGYIPTRIREHSEKLIRKRNRIDYYINKSKRIDEIIKNYQEYTYKELCMMPEIILHNENGCRL